LKDEIVQSSVRGVYVEEKRAEEELKGSRVGFRTLIGLMPDPVVIIDGRGNILVANDKLEEVTGFKREEVVGKNFLRMKMLTAKTKAYAIKQMAKRMMRMKLKPYEIEVLTKDGEKISIEINATKIEYEGKLADLVVFRDITKRKKAEEELRKTKNYLDNLLNYANAPITVWDNEKRITLFNNAFETFTGYKTEDVLGRNIDVLFSPLQKEEILQTIEKATKGEKWKSVEVPILCKDKETKIALWNSANVTDKEGKIVATIAQGQDITERKVMENRLNEYAMHMEKKVEERTRELKESEELYRTVIQASPDAIIMGDLTGKIIHVNPQAIKISRFEDEEEMIGLNPLENIIPEDRERAMSNLTKTLETGITRNTEYTLIRKDGTQYPAELSNVLIRDAKGKPKAFLSIIRDITERKQAEEALRESEKRFRNTLDNMLEGCQIIGYDWRYLYVNDAVARHGCTTKQKLLDKTMMEMYPGIEKTEMFSNLRRCMKERISIHMENEFEYPDGKKGWFELSIQPVPEGIFTLSVDITKRKQMEKERKHFEERLSAMHTYAKSLNRAETLKVIYQLTLDATEKILGFEFADILIIKGKMLCLVTHRGPSKNLSLKLPLDGDKGITVRAARTGKPVLVPDISKEKAYVESAEEMCSELVVPIKIGNKVLGVLNVESKKLAAFDEKDTELLETLASHAAIAIIDLKRHKQLRKISEKLANLMKSSTEIMHIKDTHQRLDVIAKTLRKSDWRRVVISLRDENLEGTDLVTSGLTKEEEKLLLERKAPGHVWRERLGPKFERFKIGEFYYLPWNDPWIREYVHRVPPEAPLEEATTYAGVPSKLSPEEMVDWHPQDMLYAPLRTPEGRIVGILSMDDPADGRRPTKETLAPLELFLHQAAMVIENAQLIENLRKARKQLEAHAEQLELRVEGRTRELKESEAKYRDLFENVNDIIYTLDVNGTMTSGNPAVTKVLGYSPDELKGRHFAEIIPKKYLKQTLKDFKTLLEKGAITAETVLLDKQGREHWVEYNSTTIVKDGKVVGTRGTIRDQTERKKMEEKLLKSERLAAVGELATMVGHDLRNPLQSIENATYYLNNELSRLSPSTPIPQKAIEMIQVLRDSVDYADKIIRDLQDFSATKKPMLKKTDINATVKETLSQIKAPENVGLITELGRLPRIEADKDQIKRTFLNLAVNGVQAMENGGRLKVSTKKTKGFVEISFKDTGTGMSKKNMEKLFTPFFTTRAKGMGMGLAICKKFVDAHGGSIEVESEVGKGSTFTVKLPVQ